MPFQSWSSAPHGFRPALDLLDDTLYIAFEASVPNYASQYAILTSSRGCLSQREYLRLNLPPLPPMESLPRWSFQDIQAFLYDPDDPPTWPDTYLVIYQTLSDLLPLSNPRSLTLLSLFTLLSYTFPLFDALPVLHLTGSDDVSIDRVRLALSHLAFNGNFAADDTSPTTLAILAHEGRGTQIFGDGDQFVGDEAHHPLIKLLISGSKRVTAHQYLPVGSPYLSVSTYAPRVLVSRRRPKFFPLNECCIRVEIHLKYSLEPIQSKPDLNAEDIWSPLRDCLYRLVLGRWRELAGARDSLWSSWRVSDQKSLERWFPLAAIAILISPETFRRVQEMAVESMEHFRCPQKKETSLRG